MLSRFVRFRYPIGTAREATDLNVTASQLRISCLKICFLVLSRSMISTIKQSLPHHSMLPKSRSVLYPLRQAWNIYN